MSLSVGVRRDARDGDDIGYIEFRYPEIVLLRCGVIVQMFYDGGRGGSSNDMVVFVKGDDSTSEVVFLVYIPGSMRSSDAKTKINGLGAERWG